MLILLTEAPVNVVSKQTTTLVVPVPEQTVANSVESTEGTMDVETALPRSQPPVIPVPQEIIAFSPVKGASDVTTTTIVSTLNQ